MRSDSVDTQKTIHPGAGRRRAINHPKGRQVDPAALAEVRTLLGDRPRRRDLLIEHLHLIQDRHGMLGAGLLAALAEEMHLVLAEVYEAASFYAHFEIVPEGAPPPPPLTVRVCDSVSCFLAGADRLREELAGRLGPDVRVVRTPCVGRCEHAPAAFVGKSHVDRATAESVARAVAEGQTEAELPDAKPFPLYVTEGGYRILRECRAGRWDPEDVVAKVEAAGLRGSARASGRP